MPVSISRFKVPIAQHIATAFPRFWMERELRHRPNHFEEELWLVPAFCDKDKTAIDIGANKGIYSYYMAKFSDDVIAFEPNVDLWTGLRCLLGRKFRLESAALSCASTTASLRLDQSNTGVSTIEEKNDLSCVKDQSNVVTRVVETRTLDSFEFSNIAMIKIDVEGHEEAVIEGAALTIARNRPVLLIESEDRHNPGAPIRLAETLLQQGYMGFYLKSGRLMNLNTLCSEDTDAKNLDLGLPYINNFIFIPAEQDAKLERARALFKN